MDWHECWHRCRRTRAILAKHWAVNIDPRTLAAELVVAPLTAHSLAKGIEWFTGCGITGLHRPANKMLLTWSRIGHMKIPMG
jgi:hypothetical protein